MEEKGIIPILKVDKGLAEEADGVRLMKPVPGWMNSLYVRWSSIFSELRCVP